MCLSNQSKEKRGIWASGLFCQEDKSSCFFDIRKKYITDIKASLWKRTQLMDSALGNFSLPWDLSFYCLSLQYCVAPRKTEILFTIWEQLRCIFTSLWHLVIFPCLIFMYFTCSKDWISKQAVASQGREGFSWAEGSRRAGQPPAHTGSSQG